MDDLGVELREMLGPLSFMRKDTSLAQAPLRIRQGAFFVEGGRIGRTSRVSGGTRASSPLGARPWKRLSRVRPHRKSCGAS